MFYLEFIIISIILTAATGLITIIIHIIWPNLFTEQPNIKKTKKTKEENNKHTTENRSTSTNALQDNVQRYFHQSFQNFFDDLETNAATCRKPANQANLSSQHHKVLNSFHHELKQWFPKFQTRLQQTSGEKIVQPLSQQLDTLSATLNEFRADFATYKQQNRQPVTQNRIIEQEHRDLLEICTFLAPSVALENNNLTTVKEIYRCERPLTKAYRCLLIRLFDELDQFEEQNPNHWCVLNGSPKQQDRNLHREFLNNPVSFHHHLNETVGNLPVDDRYNDGLTQLICNHHWPIFLSRIMIFYDFFRVYHIAPSDHLSMLTYFVNKLVVLLRALNLEPHAYKPLDQVMPNPSLESHDERKFNHLLTYILGQNKCLKVIENKRHGLGDATLILVVTQLGLDQVHADDTRQTIHRSELLLHDDQLQGIYANPKGIHHD